MLSGLTIKFFFDDKVMHFISLRKSTLLFLLIMLLFPSKAPASDDTLSALDELTAEDINEKKIRVFLIAKRETTISADISEKILNIPFVMGESFKQGDLLIELDSELTAAAKLRAQKELEAATVNLEAIKDLSSRGDATHVELINAERDKIVAETGLILASKNFSSCRILAPYAGRIVKVKKNEFEHIESGEPLLQIIDDNTLLAHFLLPVKDFPQIRVGTEISFTVPLLNQEFSGKISQISAILDAASSTFEVAADIDNNSGLLRAGMSGWLDKDKFKDSCKNPAEEEADTRNNPDN